MNIKPYGTIGAAIYDAGRQLVTFGKKVDVGLWQGTDVTGKPDMVTLELLNHSFSAPMTSDLDDLRADVRPNIPWADDHLLERVGGEPLNPGVQWEHWPYTVRQGPAADRFRTEGGKFTHTYMERIWTPPLDGIRYRFGNLADVLDLLERAPLTRQAFLPIWFPEDTGDVHQGRLPCTIGYQFMMRDNLLHCFYPIRACDFVRHLRDDAYLANRLSLWVLQELQKRDPERWDEVRLGFLTMHIWSLHCFMGEVHLVRKEYTQ